jgi:WD40 repeat protein
VEAARFTKWVVMGGGGKVAVSSHRQANCVDLYELILIRIKFIDWVRDVAWAPNTGMPFNIIASCSEDRSVFIWKQTERDGQWMPTLMKSFDSPVWRVSWSVTGNVLAVSTGDHSVTLWKQSVDESWVQITTVEDSADTM